jgi:hypothetical protein
MALYMGPSSNFGYGGAGQSGAPPMAPLGKQPLQGVGQSKTVPSPNAPPATSAPPNTLASQAIRASGPSQGYDPQYLQNMAGSIGSLFASPGGGQMNVNPLGNLSDISPSSGMEGNAPGQGLPPTWLQQALGGGGFSFAQPAPVAQKAPVIKPTVPVGVGGGGGRNARTL